MIRALFSALRSPQLFVPLVLLLLGALLMSKAWDLYAHKANQPLPDADVQPGSREVPSVRELRSMLSGSQAAGTRNLDIIAKHNLFTSTRRAWQPPSQEAPDGENGGEDSTRSDQQAAGRIRDVHRSKIRLYGTAMTDSGKTALVYMGPFQTQNKHFVAHAGEVLRDKGQRGEWLSFRLMSIKRDAVTLQTPGGESFDVGLYDQQSKQTKKPPRRDTSGMQITVGGERASPDAGPGGQAAGKGGDSVRSKDGGRVVPSADQDALSGSEGREAEGPSADQPEARPGPEAGQGGATPDRSQDMMQALESLRPGGQSGRDSGQSMSLQEREQQVEAGKMRKIETPFGTIYRPVDGSSKDQ